ncbi:MAG: hypothetical protein V5A23_08065 [Halobacteriales archaeon]
MASQDSEFRVEADPEKNRLYMRLSGMLDEEEALAVTERMEAEAKKLRPGFDVVNDVSEAKPVSQEATDAIERGQRLLAEAGASAVARVVGDSVIMEMQFERHGEGDDAYQVTTAESREQAEDFLDTLRERES